MAQQSGFWDSTGTGDGSASGYTETQHYQYQEALYLRDKTTEGVLKNFLNGLAVSGTATPVSIATGAAVVAGFWYINDASTTLAVSTPAASTRIDRVILRVSWSAQTVRLVLLAGVEGGSAPALTQTLNTTWEISLAQVSITTGGVITVTDERVYAHFNSEVDTSSLKDDAVTFAKMQNITTDRLLGRDTASSGNVEELTVGGGLEFSGSGGIQIANDGVTDAKIRESAALSVIGRSANSTGNPADIAAANDGEILRRSGTSLGFGTIVNGGIADGTIDDAKLNTRLFNSIVPLEVNTTQTGNVGAGQDTLVTFTVPGGTLSADGDSIWFEAFGTFANNANSKEVRVKFGASGTAMVMDFTHSAVVASKWNIRGRIIRTAAATQKGDAVATQVSSGNTTSVTYYQELSLNQTLSGDVVFTITGEGVSNNDIVIETFILGFTPGS